MRKWQYRVLLCQYTPGNEARARFAGGLRGAVDTTQDAQGQSDVDALCLVRQLGQIDLYRCPNPASVFRRVVVFANGTWFGNGAAAVYCCFKPENDRFAGVVEGLIQRVPDRICVYGSGTDSVTCASNNYARR